MIKLKRQSLAVLLLLSANVNWFGSPDVLVGASSIDEAVENRESPSSNTLGGGIRGGRSQLDEALAGGSDPDKVGGADLERKVDMDLDMEIGIKEPNVEEIRAGRAESGIDALQVDRVQASNIGGETLSDIDSHPRSDRDDEELQAIIPSVTGREVHSHPHPNITSLNNEEFGTLENGNMLEISRKLINLANEKEHMGCPMSGSITNVALGKGTSQSSTYKNRSNYVSKYGVDGDTGTAGVVHTGLDYEPWWEVKLGSQYAIDHVVIHNHPDLSFRLRGFRLEIFNYDNNDALWTYDDPTESGSPGDEIRIDIPDCLQGDRVKISIPGEKMFLRFRELEVFGPRKHWKHLQAHGLCADLDLTDVTQYPVNGMEVKLKECQTDALSQQWYFNDDGLLENRYASRCLEAGRSPTKYNKLFVWGCGNYDHQKWQQDESTGRFNLMINKSYYIGVSGCANKSGSQLIDSRLELHPRFSDGNCVDAQTWHMGCPMSGSITNVALFKDTSQSSTYKNRSNYVSKYGVDGDTGTAEVVHTGLDYEPWWEVELGSQYAINHVVIYNHPDLSQRLQGFRLEIFNSGNNVALWTYDDPTEIGKSPGDEIRIDIPVCLQGDRVKISIPDERMFLRFRELEVFGSLVPAVQALKHNLHVFQQQTQSCETDGLAIAAFIKQEIVPNFRRVNPLFKSIDKLLKPLDKIAKRRPMLEMIVKFIPKVGKLVGLVLEKLFAIHSGLTGFRKSLGKLGNTLTPAEYKALTGNTLGDNNIFSVADSFIYKLERLANLLDNKITKGGVIVKTGLANTAGHMADAAEKSLEAIDLAHTLCGAKEVEDLALEIGDEVKFLTGASMTCTAIPRALMDLKLSIIAEMEGTIHDMLEILEPFIDTIFEIIATVTSELAEAACCYSSPHIQGVVKSVAAVVDFGTCFAGPLEGLLDDLLRELVPDFEIDFNYNFGSIPLYNFTFDAIEYNEDDCTLDFEYPKIEPNGIFDLSWSWYFNFHESLGIEDDGLSFEDDLKKSCNPDKLADDLKNAFGGDCCCPARDIEYQEGTFCLDWDAVEFAIPGVYEAFAELTGYGRCTCCKDGIFETAGCGGRIGYCGSELPPQKSLGDSCPSTADCECVGSLECGKKDYFNEDKYVCCKDSFVPLGWTTDLCVQQNEGDRCPTTEDAECAGSMGCALDQAGDDGKYVCCSKHSIYFDRDYCNNLSNGKKCWSNAMCASGYCKGNNGGLNKGTCTRKLERGEKCAKDIDCKNDHCARPSGSTNKLVCCKSDDLTTYYAKDYCTGMPVNQYCHTNAMCANGACGRPSFGADKKVCCKSGSVTSHWGYDYCRGMPEGQRCDSDAMCSTGLCLNSKCTRKKKEGERCYSQKNAECWNRSCYRSTRYGNYRCCHDTNFCDAWDGGCTTGYWYCDDYGDRLG